MKQYFSLIKIDERYYVCYKKHPLNSFVPYLIDLDPVTRELLRDMFGLSENTDVGIYLVETLPVIEVKEFE